jgi:hypothetical protein
MPVQQQLPDLSQSYRPSLYAAALITYAVTVSAVILRFTARRFTHLRLWYDDWQAVVALVRHPWQLHALIVTDSMSSSPRRLYSLIQWFVSPHWERAAKDICTPPLPPHIQETGLF